jgi:Na+/proline symporter
VISAGLFITLFFLSTGNGGLKEVYSYLQTNQHEQIQLFPSAIKSTSSLAWHNFIVYFFIQWWSVRVLDGAGPEAQRFINVKTGFDAFKAAILPVVLSLLFFVPLYISFDVAWVHALKNPELIMHTAEGTPNYELFYFSTMHSMLPGFAGALFFLVMLIFFINLQEYFLNWGAGFITVDLFKTYLRKRSTDRELRVIGYLAMFLIAVTSIIFTYYRDTTLGLQELFLAMGAGVGPVFILRWFFGRINAWSQLTAMLSSLVFTFSYDALYRSWPGFNSFISQMEQQVPLDFFTLKIVLLTFLVTALWILVTFLTPKDEYNHLKTFAETVKPGGIWPEGINAGKKNWGKYFILLILFAVMATLPFVFLWYIRFGSIIISVVMILVYAGLFVLIWKSMRKNFEDNNRIDSNTKGN